MRIYLFAGDLTGGHGAIAPEVPGAACEGTREGALDTCRRWAAEERAAFERLGLRLDVSEREEVLEWGDRWWLVPELFVPPTRGWMRAVLARTREVETEIGALVDGLPAAEWDTRPDGEWSIRLILDHVANGQWLGLLRLEPWPLDPADAQAGALDDLHTRLTGLRGKTAVTEHFGLNREGRRVRWTPRKVLRVVRAQQEAWLAHLGGTGAEPPFPPPHDDEPGDDEPVNDPDLTALLIRGRALRQASAGNPVAAGKVAWRYRYYRDRLAEWPSDVRERWRAIGEEFHRRFAGLTDAERALVRVAPTGTCYTARQALHLGLGHLRDHCEQIRRAREVVSVRHAS